MAYMLKLYTILNLSLFVLFFLIQTSLDDFAGRQLKLVDLMEGRVWFVCIEVLESPNKSLFELFLLSDKVIWEQ